jgi:hypothetical protein
MKDKLLFLVSPFFSFIRSIRLGFTHKSHKTILFWFSGFVGLNFAIASESSDINRYRDKFLAYGTRGFDYFFQFLSDYISFKAKHYDILTEIIYYTLSRFTDNPYILYLILGLIFGYFYSSVISRIGEFNINLKVLDYLLIISLLFVVFPTKGINQFRFYTASFIFLHGTLSYILDNKKKKSIIFLTLALLTHIGMALPIIGFILFAFLGKLNIKLVLLLLFISLLGGYGLSFLEPVINLLGGAAESKYLEYTGSIANERMEGFRERIWYAAYYREILVVGISLPLFRIIKNRNYLDKKDNNLIKFGLFLMIITSFTINSFMYHRYFDLLAIYLIFFTTYYFFKYRDPVLKKYLFLISPVLLLMIGINVSGVFRFLNPFIFIDNIFTVWFFQ